MVLTHLTNAKFNVPIIAGQKLSLGHVSSKINLWILLRSWSLLLQFIFSGRREILEAIMVKREFIHVYMEIVQIARKNQLDEMEAVTY